MLTVDGSCRSHQQRRHCLQEYLVPLTERVVESDRDIRDIDDCAYEINTVERSMEVLSTVRLRTPPRASHITSRVVESEPSVVLGFDGGVSVTLRAWRICEERGWGNIHSSHATWDVGADILRWIKQTNFVLRERNGDMLAPEPFKNGVIQFSLRLGEIRSLHPQFDGNCHG